MKKAFTWFRKKKFFTKALFISAFLIAITLFFLTSIAKWYINKNGESMIGRNLHVNEININYFTMSLTVEDFTMYEVNKKDTFIYLGNLYVNLDPWKIINNEYSFSQVSLDRLKLKVIQYETAFNFSDLISEEEKEVTPSDPAKYLLKNLTISNSNISYFDGVNQKEYPLRNLNLSLPELAWNSDVMDIDLLFKIGEKGNAEIKFLMDNARNKYDLDLITNYINIEYGENYVKDVLNVNSITGYLHTNLNVKGDLIDAMDIKVKGTTSISTLKIIDARGKDFITMDSIAFVIDSINLRQNYYSFNQTLIQSPTFFIELERTKTNIDDVLAPLFTPEDTVQEIDSSQNIAATYFFEMKEVDVKGGRINYLDKTLNRPFQYSIKNLDLKTTGISPSSTNLLSIFSFNMEGKSKVSGDMKINLVNTNNLQFNSAIKNVNLISFSPYTEYYISSPITQGVFNYKISVDMNDVSLVNENDINIRELEFGKKIKSDSAYKVPIKLALTLLKDKNDNIQFNVPVSGNPSDPDFKIFPIIWKTFGTFLVKVAASPLNAMSSMAGKNAEDLEFLSYQYGQTALSEQQIEMLDKIIEFHTEKPELTFTFNQMANVNEEIDFITIQEAKKLYSTDNWKEIEDNDKGFIQFLQTKTGLIEEKSVLKLARKIIPKDKAKSLQTAAVLTRNKLLLEHLSIVENASEFFIIQTADLINLPEEMKKPQFKIEVGVQ